MKTTNNSWKKRIHKPRLTRIPHYSSPMASIIALQQKGEGFDIYQITKGHDNRMLTRSNWKYSSSKRTLKC